MKNPRYYNKNRTPYAWSNLNFIDKSIDVTTIMDIIEDAISGEDLVCELGKLRMVHRVWTIDRETETMVRIKHVDMLGNVTYIECEKEPSFLKEGHIYTVGELKKLLLNYRNDTLVFIGCQGYTNYDFDKDNLYNKDSITRVNEYDGKLFITDGCALENKDGTIVI